MSVADTKAELRRLVRARRRALGARERREAAALACVRLLRLPQYRSARHVALYFSVAGELSTKPLLQAVLDSGRRVYVPRLGPHGRMQFVALEPGTPLQRNRHGIPEPAATTASRSARRMDLIVLPLVGFDGEGRRLGAGGGYYDRSLAFPRPFRRPYLLGYAYAVQRLDAVPSEPHDIRMDAVVTERRIFRFTE